MKYRFLISVLFLWIGCSSLFSQDKIYRTIEENTDIFHGKWVAQNGNMSYEMTLKREFISVGSQDGLFPPSKMETLWGKIKYFENGKIIRETPDNGSDAIVSLVLIPNMYDIFFTFIDREKNVHRHFDFIVDRNDHTKAVWKYEPESQRKRRGGGSNTEPDIPDGMTWTKVE